MSSREGNTVVVRRKSSSKGYKRTRFFLFVVVVFEEIKTKRVCGSIDERKTYEKENTKIMGNGSHTIFLQRFKGDL